MAELSEDSVSQPQSAKPSSYRSPELDLGSFAIDEYAPLKVIIIGAGLSGIVAGIRFIQRIPNLELVIYDKNSGIGGTWFSNRYPGLACDIPSHSYQYTFTDKTDWSAYYAPRDEILAYIESVAARYKLLPYIRLNHEMVSATYNELLGQWRVRIRRPVPNTPGEFEEIEDNAHLLFTGLGGLSRWKWPVIDGLNSFRGTLLHSAHWEVTQKQADASGTTNDQISHLRAGWEEDVKGWKNKRVAVIGVGSSALQLVPALQPRVGRVCNYVRGQTWLATPFASGKLASLLTRNAKTDNYVFSEEEKREFHTPEYYRTFRKELESDLNSTHQCTLMNSAMQSGARAAFEKQMRERLAKKPWIADHLVPDFGVACRRLTPGPGYLEALCEDNVDFIPIHIKRITETGIETVDGKFQELDIIICATGYDTTFQYPFPIIGRNGIDIRERWSPHPETYLSVCVDGFPNWFFSLGPNSAVGSGSLLALIEQQVGYAVQAGMKMQRERLKSIEVKRKAVKDYDTYIERYFPTTVYSQKCRSWYKMGKEEGRIVGLWPGSCLHALRALRYPRWEDFNYEAVDAEAEDDCMFWLGNGMTLNEQNMSGDRAWYLDDKWVDPPPVPEDKTASS